MARTHNKHPLPLGQSYRRASGKSPDAIWWWAGTRLMFSESKEHRSKTSKFSIESFIEKVRAGEYVTCDTRPRGYADEDLD
jgi:hypothetical protein